MSDDDARRVDDAEARTARELASLPGYDLPILDELGERFARQAREALREPSKPRRRGWRVGRRVAITAAAGVLVGTTAIAARSIVDHRDAAVSPHRLLRGGSGDGAYELTAYRVGARMCLAVKAGEQLASRCAAPARATGIEVLSATGPSRRFVAGLAGGDVAAVVVRVGSATVRVATRAAPETAVGPGVRFFVAGFDLRPGGAAHQPSARLRALDRRGTPVGRGLRDCSLGAGEATCRRGGG